MKGQVPRRGRRMGGSREDGALVKVGRELRQRRPEYNAFLFKIVLYAFQDHFDILKNYAFLH